VTEVVTRRLSALGRGIGLWLLLALTAAPARAQNLADALWLAPGLEASEAEHQAFGLAEQRRWIRAREEAEKILAKDRNSFVAQLVLGQVQHYGEANAPRALFHLSEARRLYEARFGTTPSGEVPWRWHANILRELTAVYGDLEQPSTQLALMALFNELYEPDMVAERSWPLMKLGRNAEARAVAQKALELVERPMQRTIALNSLCAIEFEAGNDGASYEACRAAVDDASAGGASPSAVDLTNFAEASRSMFKLDEAERVQLEATEAPMSWYGNPWLELADLYTRQGRLPEAISALKKVPAYLQERPPHVRNVDRNEVQRVLAGLLLVAGRDQSALDLTEQALSMPDRRGHNSRDPHQDLTVVALLDRRARLVGAERALERGSVRSIWERLSAQLSAFQERLAARRSAARVERLLDDDARLVGSFRIGTSAAAVMPPWLAGELLDVLGPAVAEEALRRAQARDQRPGASGYYDAFRAERALLVDEPGQAVAFGKRALAVLGPSEVLLRARLHAVMAEAALQSGDGATAAASYDAAFQSDPGVFRRLGLAVPVRIEAHGALGEDLAERLARSPRLEPSAGGFTLRIDATAVSGKVCLSAPSGNLGCAELAAKANEAAEPFAIRLCDAFHEQLFAPRVDLTQADVNSLDGHNLSGRDALKDLLGE
jgi:tetratricopeptide (TPR) repeat protein